MSKLKRTDYSLCDKSDFHRLAKRGYVWHEKPLRVVYLPRKANDCDRFGLAVGRKVGKATVRNLIKRRLRLLSRQYIVTSTDQQKGDWLLLARPSIKSMTFSDLSLTLKRAAKGARRKAPAPQEQEPA